VQNYLFGFKFSPTGLISIFDLTLPVERKLYHVDLKTLIGFMFKHIRFNDYF